MTERFEIVEKALIKMLEERWCEEGMSMEAQYSFIHAMRKDD